MITMAITEAIPETQTNMITIDADELQAMLDRQKDDVVTALKVERRKVFTRRFLGQLGTGLAGLWLVGTLLINAAGNEFDSQSKEPTDQLRLLNEQAEGINSVISTLDTSKLEGLSDLAQQGQAIQNTIGEFAEAIGVDLTPPPDPCTRPDGQNLLGPTAVDGWCGADDK